MPNLVKANLIIEAANGPITYEADKILEQNGVVIIPDMVQRWWCYSLIFLSG